MQFEDWKETATVTTRASFDSEQERNVLLTHARQNMTVEQFEELMIEWAINDLLKKAVERLPPLPELKKAVKKSVKKHKRKEK